MLFLQGNLMTVIEKPSCLPYIKFTCMDLMLLVRANSEKLHGNNEQILLFM